MWNQSKGFPPTSALGNISGIGSTNLDHKIIYSIDKTDMVDDFGTGVTGDDSNMFYTGDYTAANMPAEAFIIGKYTAPSNATTKTVKDAAGNIVWQEAGASDGSAHTFFLNLLFPNNKKVNSSNEGIMYAGFVKGTQYTITITDDTKTGAEAVLFEGTFTSNVNTDPTWVNTHKTATPTT